MYRVKGNTEYWFRLSLKDFSFYLLPWWRNDGYRGFFHFLFIHLNWYPNLEKEVDYDNRRAG